MATFWWCVLGLLTCGYFALAGYDYGVGMLLPAFEGDERKRRRTLGALGPFFLANEVWLVAAVGLLFGAFPHLEGKVFAGAYVLVVTLLLGLVTFTASLQLRSRRPDARRGAWTAGIVGGALVTALSWGLFLGNLVLGLPPVADVLAFFNPYAALWGLGFVALFCLQGAAFLAVRAPAELTGRAVRLARAFLPPVFAFLVIATGWGFFALPGVTALGVGVVALAFAALAVRGSASGSGATGWRSSGRWCCGLPGAAGRDAAVPDSAGVFGLRADRRRAADGVRDLRGPGLVRGAGGAVLLAVQWLTRRAHRHPVDQRSLLHF